MACCCASACTEPKAATEREDAFDGQAQPAPDEAKHHEDGGGFFADAAHFITDFASDLAHKGQEVVESAAAIVVSAAQKAIDSTVGPQVHAFGTITKKFGDKMEDWLLQQLLVTLTNVIDQLPSTIKSNLNSDPDMNQWLWKKICRLIDKSWPEMRKEITDDLALMLGVQEPPTKKNVDNSRTPLCLRGPCCLRRRIRYSIMPWDKSLWGKLRSPFFIAFLITIWCPIAYVSAVPFLIYFLVIDVTDEYQLVKFILFNKSSQFVAHGVIRVIVGYFVFFNCVTTFASATDHSCDTNGPGRYGPMWLVLTGWILQFALCWLAALLLICANPRQGMQEQHSSEEAGEEEESKTPEEKAENGENQLVASSSETAGRSKLSKTKAIFKEKIANPSAALLHNVVDEEKKHMRRIIMYDAVCTLLVAGAMVWAGIEVHDLDSFVTRQTVFAGQLTYGLMALPFFVFQLPICQKLLLHIKPTAYDQQGNCRFYRGPTKKEKPGCETNLQSLVMDVDKLLSSLMSCFGGEEARTGAPDAHDFKDIERAAGDPRIMKCKHCGTRMRDPAKQGKRCTFCTQAFCNACAEHEEHCAKAPEVHVEKQLTIEERYQNFSANFKFTFGVLHSMMHAQSKEEADKFMKLVKTWMKRQSNEAVEAVIERIPVIVKWSMEDEDMPRKVQKMQNKFVDQVWKDMHEEILYSTKVMLEGEAKGTPEEDTRKKLDCFRAKIRYSEYPYNKSIFWQVKQPLWWIMRLIPFIPWGPVLPLFFLFVFLIIDRSDEFQLVQFILLFKGTLFISHGLIKTIVGFFQYLGCTSHSLNGFDHTCATAGPGIQAGWRVFEITFSGWCLQILLVWAAFLLLPLSEDKGRVDITPPEGEDETKIKRETTMTSKKGGLKAGGKIRFLVYWDMCVFFACLGIMIWLFVVRGIDWVTMQAFYACQVMYGYCSFPFFLFNLPVIRETYTHSVPTGYDQFGRIRSLEPEVKSQDLLDEQMKQLEREDRKRRNMPEVPDDPTDEGFLGTLIQEIRELFRHMFGDLCGTPEAPAQAHPEKEKEEHGGMLHAFASRWNLHGGDKAATSVEHAASDEAAKKDK